MFRRYIQNAGTLLRLNNFGVNIARHYCHIYDDVNDAVQKWIQTLSEIDSKKIRYFLNEIRWNALNSPESAPNPTKLTIADYSKLLQLSNNQRKHHYRYLTKNQYCKNDAKMKIQISKIVDDKTAKRLNTKHLFYGIGHNTILTRFTDNHTIKWKHKRLFNEMLFSPQQIIFDCGFDREMTYEESSMTAKALALSFFRNRDHQQPFVMNLHNLNPNGPLRMNLKKHIKYIDKDIIPLGLHRTSYIDHIAKEKLCVITNEASQELREIDPEMHYVIGGIVKKGYRNPFMNSRAKELGLQTARLPVDSYRKMRYNKVIPLHQIVQILLELRRSGDWDKAFEFIDRHRLK